MLDSHPLYVSASLLVSLSFFVCKVGVNTIPFPTSLTSRGHDEEAPSHLFHVNFAARAISPAESQYSASNMSSTFRHQIASVSAIGRLELVVSWEGSRGRHVVLWNSGRLLALSCYSQGSCCHPWVVKRRLQHSSEMSDGSWLLGPRNKDSQTPWTVSPRTCRRPNWCHGSQDLLVLSLPSVGRHRGRV